MLINRIKNDIRRHDIISFDIFDTLLFRPYMTPDDLFKYMEQITGEYGFYSARINAENKFYLTRNKSDANLDDIYSVIPEYAHLKQTELDLETSGLIANPEIIQVYNWAKQYGKRIIITSDMYLPLKFINDILQKNGITGYEKIYLSNVVYKRKDRGDMFDFIVKDINVAPKNILHIGDNKKSDYIMARKHKFDAVLYKRHPDFLSKNRLFQTFWKSNKPELDASIITALASQYIPKDDYWRDFGYRVAGPVAYAYTKYILDVATTEKIKKILFVARDGWLAEQIFNIIKQSDIQTKYVYAPRVLNYTANLDYDSKLPEQARIICEYFKQDVGNMAPTQYIKQNIKYFQSLAFNEKEKTGYKKYIDDITKNFKTIGTVDTISGQLSGQRLIQQESSKKTIGCYVATLPGRDVLNKFEHRDFFTDEIRDKFLQNNLPDLIELIFSAPENPIITMATGAPVYQTILNPAEKIRHDICSRIAIGAKEFADDITKRTDNRGVKITPNAIYSLLEAFISHPSRADFKAMFDVKKSPYADNSVYVPLFASPTLTDIRTIKKLIWKNPAQRVICGLISPLKIYIRGLKSIKILLFPNLSEIFSVSLFNRYIFSFGKDKK